MWFEFTTTSEKAEPADAKVCRNVRITKNQDNQHSKPTYCLCSSFFIPPSSPTIKQSKFLVHYFLFPSSMPPCLAMYFDLLTPSAFYFSHLAPRDLKIHPLVLITVFVYTPNRISQPIWWILISRT